MDPLRRPAPLFTLVVFAIGCAALPAPAVAGGDIIKCVAPDGHVTLTDRPCSGGDASVLVAAGTASPRAALAPAALALTPVPPPQLQHDNWINPRPEGKTFARDAATLRAARASLQVLDAATASAHQQRVAGLN